MIKLDIDRGKLEEVCRKHQVEFLRVFGSVARGENSVNSDMDIVVGFKKGARVGLFELADVEDELSEYFGRKVDLVPDGSVSPYIEPYITKDLVQIYGGAG